MFFWCGQSQTCVGVSNQLLIGMCTEDDVGDDRGYTEPAVLVFEMMQPVISP